MLGLAPENAYQYLYIVEESASDKEEQSWIIKDYKDQGAKLFVVFENIGYASWNTVILQEGKIKKHDLLPFKGTLVFPWELEEKAEETEEFSMVLPSHQVRSQDTFNIAKEREELDRPILMILNYLQHLLHGDPFQPLGVPLVISGNMTEEETIRYLTENGFMELFVNRALWCEPTAKDMRNFMARHGASCVKPPMLMFVVPYEEYPLDDIYAPNGVAHLSYKDVPEWLKNREMRFEMLEMPKVIYNDYHKDNQNTFCGGRFDHLVKKPKQRQKHGGTVASQERRPHIADIEDLCERAAPPCLQNKMREQKWYKDQERTQLVAQLRCGGVSEGVVEQIFDRAAAYNENPKKNAWNYKYAWDRGYVGAKCEVFIENAKQKIQDTIHCPFASKDLCHAQFKENFPSLVKPWDELKRPFSILLWHGRLKK